MKIALILLLELLFIEVLALVILSIIAKRHSKQIPKKPFSIKEKIKNLRTEQYVIIGLYIIIFSTIGYLILANFFPNSLINTSGTYTLSAESIGITSKLRSLYIDKDYVLGDKITIDDKTVRQIISAESFNIIFNPKKVIQENTTAKLELSFIGKGTDIYLNDNLIIPNLNDYEKIKDYTSKEIWIKKTLIKRAYEIANTAENFIYKNFPQHSIYSFAELSGGTPIIQDYEKTTTKINTQFRDNLKLAVYAEGNLNIEFTKQDLNSYVGKDEYTVEITDFQGKQYFKEVYEDDGEKKGTGVSDEEQDFEINLYNLPRSIYYIIFTKDAYNKAADSTIKDIEINSNKVLILGTSLPWGKFEFYIKVSSPKTISFLYWWKGKEQKIEQTGAEEDIINLNEDWLSKKYEQELNVKGDYNFEIKTGYLNVYSDIISPSKQNWFYFPQKADKKLLDSDIIIIDKNKLKINSNEMSYLEEVEINSDTKFKIQVLDENKLYFRSVKLTL